jgi:HEAT repeat protein
MTTLPRPCFSVLASLTLALTLAPFVDAQSWRQKSVDELLFALTSDDAATIEAASAEIARRGPADLERMLGGFIIVVGGHKDAAEKTTAHFERMGAALGRMGPAAVPALQTLVSESGSLEAIIASLALGDMGPPAAPAAPTLVRALAGENPMVRGVATQALAKMGPGVLPALFGGLKDANADVRWSSAVALGTMKAEPRRTVPALTAALRDSDRFVRLKAAEALAAFGVEARPAVPELLAAGDSNDDIELAEAVLAVVGSSRVELTRALSAGQRPAAERAAIALRQANPPAIAELTAALAGVSPITRKAALVGLTMADGATPSSYQPAARLLDDPDLDVRVAALGLMRQMPEAALPALPRIAARLRDPDVRVRAAAATALAGVARNPEELQPLLTLLQDPVPEVRSAAVDELSQRSAGPASVTLLMKIVTTDTSRPGPVDIGWPSLAARAAMALGRVGPSAGLEAQRTLTSLLTSKDPEMRTAAVVGFARWGAAAAPVVPDIARAMSTEPNAAALRTYLQALGKIGPAARPALDAVQKLTRHEDEAVRGDAAAALTAIGGR